MGSSPREDQRLILAFDGGSFSVKLCSDKYRGSFISAAALAERDTLGGFGGGFADTDSHYIEIVGDDNGSKGRWVVGEQAQSYENVQRYSRNIQRFKDQIFHVFVCAALKAAFANKGYPVEERKFKDGRSRVPVHAVVSIAPGYYANSRVLAEAAKGIYEFVDLRTNMFYSFSIESSTVVPEGWGIYASRLYDIKDGQVVRRNAKAFVHSTVAILDVGGRTTDTMAWTKGSPVNRTVDSMDIGIVSTIEEITRSVLQAHSSMFSVRPTREQVIAAIEKGDKASLRGQGGEIVPVGDIIRGHMRQLASSVWEVYQNKFAGGQGIDALMYGGGGSKLIRPYLNKQHVNEIMVASTLQGMYMANAIGAWMYAAYRQKEGENA